jgi:hypothetical protein
MITCSNCGSVHPERSRFCDQCGTRLADNEAEPFLNSAAAPVSANSSELAEVHVTSLGIPPIVQDDAGPIVPQFVSDEPSEDGHAILTIERGEAANTEFVLTNDESNIGRWDADNGIFPDVDLDPYDPDAKVSRRHARITRRDNAYYIEDLGSTNGTFVNRGRRLLPGQPQVLSEGDEIIVGKTFLRFNVN